MMLNTKQEIFKKFGRTPQDTGSPEVQIALLTERINNLSNHLKDHKKDIHSRQGLMKQVNLRKRLLRYLSKKNHEQYKHVLQTLNLRK